MRRLTALLAVLLLAIPLTARAAEPVDIVAAENVYGDVAQQIGGPAMRVTSILRNPEQDPHLFEASASAARAISGARIVIYNGADYDPWMPRLLRSVKSADRTVIVVAELVGTQPGQNPHIWYDPRAVLACARSLATALRRTDPEHAAVYQARLARFEQSMQTVTATIARLRARFAGAPVTATEPVFDAMLEAMGMAVRNMPFQLAVMNDTEPSMSEVAAFETDLKQHRVRLLVYNSQAAGGVAERMRKLARASHVPVVAVTETEPRGSTYQSWVTAELDAVEQALSGR